MYIRKWICEQRMAICFVKSRYIGRSSNGNACNSSAYNARSKIVNEGTGEVFNYSKRNGNVYHEVMLPDGVDQKFKDISILSNEVEKNELRKDSQLYVEWVLALPKEEEITLEMKKELVYRFIEYKGWIKERVGVQLNIHEPHDKNDNWHAHLLTPTRRFTKDGKGFERLKARDLQPKVAGGFVVEETKDSIAYTAIQNEYFKECGLDLRVDLPGMITQEHVGPVRMRSILNQAQERNEQRVLANIESLQNGEDVVARVADKASVFNRGDIERAVKCIPDKDRADMLIEEALCSKSLLSLYDDNGKKTDFYTTIGIRKEEEKLLRLSGYVAGNKNIFTASGAKIADISKQMIDNLQGSLTEEQHAALSHLIMDKNGMRIMRGRAGTGKSHVLGQIATIAEATGVGFVA